MGIKNLSKLISDHAAGSVREQEMKSFFNRKVAVDASMSIYQFMIAVRSGGEDGQPSANLTNAAGEITSHLQGMFYRTIRMMSNGIKPCFVFDGKPPVLKSGELAKRSAGREKAAEELQKAIESENKEDIEKFNRRLVRVSKQENDECKRLLRLMGVPVVEAPGEAEAQCAALCKAGLVYAVATEDMDALTFGAPVLARHMTFSEARKEPIVEFKLSKVLEDFKLSHDEFIDLCILCGCDYTGTIRGIGPHRAFELIAKHRTIEEVLKHIDRVKHQVPEEFLFKEAAELFRNPDILDPATLQLEWKDPDESGLLQFLVEEKGFSQERVLSGIAKLKGAKATSNQTRLENFFGATSVVSSSKRKEPPAKESKGGGKKAKPAAKGAAAKGKKM